MTLLRTLLSGRTTRLAFVGACAVLLVALFAPLLSSWDPDDIDLSQKLQAPTREHLLGTDHLGRDVLARLLHGARASLGSVAVIVAAILLLSLSVGSVAGYAGGMVDAFLMRLCDTFLTFPTFILAMFLIGILGAGMTNVILAIVCTHWAWYARIIRGLVLSLKTREHVLAARVAGTGQFRLVMRHILPGVLPQILVLATLDIGHMMLHVSGLSFLGLGVQPPTAEWGVMINDARQYIWTQPQLLFYPGLAIFVTVMAFNLLGDGLRDALDPVGETGGWGK